MSYKIPDKYLKMIMEFEQKDINKIFQVGNTVTFFVKTGNDTHPIKLQVIAPPSGQPSPNVFFAKNTSPYPIDVRGAYFQINNPNQDIRTGKFDVLVIGKEDKNGKVIPSKSKYRYSFKNIHKVDARDAEGNLIDSYYTNEHDAANDTANVSGGDSQEKVVAFKEVIGELSVGESLVLVLADKSSIVLDYIDTKQMFIQFEYNDNSNLSANYQKLAEASSIELSMAPDDVTYDEKNKTISVKARAFHKVNDELVPTESVITDISDFSIGDAGDDAGDEDEGDNIESTEKLRAGKKTMELILKDPLLQQAFYKQPSFMELFKAELTGRKATGTGIITAINIVRNYRTKQLEEKLGAKFIKKEKVIFSPLREVVIPYQDKNSKPSKFILDPSKTYAAIVRNRQIDDVDVVLENSMQGYRILVKDKTDFEDVYLCQVIKVVIVGKEPKEYPSRELVRIKFSRESPGYEPVITKTQPRQNVIKKQNK